MKPFTPLLLAITLTIATQAHPHIGVHHCELSPGENENVMLALTAFDMNETTLTLDYQIKNLTDHDIWICDSFNMGLHRFLFSENNDYETVFMDEGKALTLRRRPSALELSRIEDGIIVQGRYVRLRPGEERTNTLLARLPILESPLFTRSRAPKVNHAASLTLDIGYFDVDLPATIRVIVSVGEKLGWTQLAVGLLEHEREILSQYFGGFLEIARSYRSVANFDAVHGNADDSFTLSEWDARALRRQTHPYRPGPTGEKALQLTITGIHIPYHSN